MRDANNYELSHFYLSQVKYPTEEYCTFAQNYETV